MGDQYKLGYKLLTEHGLHPLPEEVVFLKNGRNKFRQRWINGRTKGPYWKLDFLGRGLPGLIIEGHQCMAYTDFDFKRIIILSGMSDEDFTQTMLHEIAHVKLGEGGHGRAWMKKALELGCTLEHVGPYMVEYAMEEEGLTREQVAAKYQK